MGRKVGWNCLAIARRMRNKFSKRLAVNEMCISQYTQRRPFDYIINFLHLSRKGENFHVMTTHTHTHTHFATAIPFRFHFVCIEILFSYFICWSNVFQLKCAGMQAYIRYLLLAKTIIFFLSYFCCFILVKLTNQAKL